MNHLGIFVKQPLPGLVKTRLGAVLGAEPAAELYELFQKTTTHKFSSFPGKSWLCYAPDQLETKNYFAELAGTNHGIVAQQPGDLTARLNGFIDFCFSGHHAEKVVVIGSDSPTFPVKMVEEALSLLEESECVLGPAQDGGFTLVALKQPRPEIFQNVTWSSAQVLDQVMQNLQGSGIPYRLLSPPWYDIDTVEDLVRLRADLNQMKRDQAAEYCENTEYYERLLVRLENEQAGEK